MDSYSPEHKLCTPRLTGTRAERGIVSTCSDMSFFWFREGDDNVPVLVKQLSRERQEPVLTYAEIHCMIMSSVSVNIEFVMQAKLRCAVKQRSGPLPGSTCAVHKALCNNNFINTPSYPTLPPLHPCACRAYLRDNTCTALSAVYSPSWN